MAMAVASSSVSRASASFSSPSRQRTSVMTCSIKFLSAAKLAVNNIVKDGMVVGLGCGPASSLAIRYMAHRLQEGALKDIIGIPMSVSCASEATKAGISLNTFHDSIQIDFAFHDADITEEGSLAAVIGRRKKNGEESLLLEKKSVVQRAGMLALMVPEEQFTRDLDGSIPVLVKTGNWMETAEEIDDLFLGNAEVWRRPTSGVTGPLGGNLPLVTKEGHHILDVIFTSPIQDIAEVVKSLDQIDGVVDHGVIYGIPCTVIIDSLDGVIVVDNFAKAPSNE